MSTGKRIERRTQRRHGCQHEQASAGRTGNRDPALRSETVARAETSPHGSDTDSETRHWKRLRSVVLGLFGGVFATIVMTVFRMPISNSLPPTAHFLARFLGGEPDDYTLSAFALHLAYGATGGGVYGFLFEDGDARTQAEREFRDVSRALGYSFGLSLFGSRVILSNVLGMDLERDEELIFHVGHAVYGLALGAWVGSNR